MRAPARCPSISAVVILCVVLLAITAAGCGSTAAGTKTYAGADNGYSFDYPASWELKESNSADVTAGGSAIAGVSAYDPDGAVVDDTYIDLAQLSVYKLRFPIRESMLDEIRPEVAAVLASLESQATDMKIVEALSQTTVSGLFGFRATYTFNKGGTPATSTLYFLFSGDLEYQWTLQAATENWGGKAPAFEALIASFKPGPAE